MIKILPQEIADKIAAGEVVERPLSIVKELIENSIDAGATAITCEIKKGGKEYIRVTDNGRGIPKDEVRLAFMRYATSKISTEEDLNAIGTLGFRGEALASIAAVSRTELITKPAGQQTGTKIAVLAGDVDEFTDSACEDGTTIIVTDLFFNIPARRKFLKPDNSEASLITDYVSKMALAYPGVKFRLISNGTILYSTLGKGDLKQAILTLYNPQLAKGLVDIGGSEGNMSIYGSVTSPAYSRNNKRWQIFFVNGRWVKSKVMEDALEEAFSDKLFDGRHPAAFLFLTVDPTTIDVNIHPHKTDIKFFDERAVAEFMVKAIRRSMLTADAAPDVSEAVKTCEEDIIAPVELTKPEEPAEFRYKELESKTEGSLEKKIPGLGMVNVIPFSLTNTKNDTENIFAQIRSEAEKAEISVQETIQTYNPQAGQQVQPRQIERQFWFTGLNIIGQAFATYILAMDENCVYFVDQHAAHERILYEKLTKKFTEEETASQPMLMPLLLQMTVHEKEAAAEKIALLEQLGYRIEDFGPGDIIIKEIPACMDMSEAEDFARHLMDSETLTKADSQLKRDSVISASCKAAIKANDRLSPEEMKHLFVSLDACENPFSCPHGRPTFLKFTLNDIERLFKRK